jgi:hypothetical protein
MSRILLLNLVLTLCIVSCHTTKYEFFGEKFKPVSDSSFEEMVSNMSAEDTLQTRVSARVEAVCQAKGCWMNLSPLTAGSDQQVFVKFKDYGFFMPKDIAGREVIIDGKAYKEITSVDELRHYAEDEGKSKEEIEKITEPVEELKFMASGVALKKN